MNITTFAQCERMALESKPPRKTRGPAPVPVGRYVAKCLFDRLCGTDATGLERPDAMTFDARTRFEYPDAYLQVNSMWEAARKALEDAGETIVERAAEPADAYFITRRETAQVRGTPITRRALILLVTADNIGARWLLAGQKAYQYDEASDVPTITHVGILHVPRPHKNRSAVATLDVRRYEDLREAWDPWRNRIHDVIDGLPARAVPGHHCRRCYITDCAVRTT